MSSIEKISSQPKDPTDILSEQIGKYLAENNFSLKVSLLNTDKERIIGYLEEISNYCMLNKHKYDGVNDFNSFIDAIDEMIIKLTQFDFVEDLDSEDVKRLELILSLAGVTVD